MDLTTEDQQAVSKELRRRMRRIDRGVVGIVSVIGLLVVGSAASYAARNYRVVKRNPSLPKSGSSPKDTLPEGG